LNIIWFSAFLAYDYVSLCPTFRVLVDYITERRWIEFVCTILNL
jgi:hypothetical protein